MVIFRSIPYLFKFRVCVSPYTCPILQLQCDVNIPRPIRVPNKLVVTKAMETSMGLMTSSLAIYHLRLTR